MGDGYDEPSVARGTGAIRVRARLQAVQNEKWADAVGLTAACGASPVRIDDRPAAAVVVAGFQGSQPQLAPPIPLQHTHVHVRPVFLCALPQRLSLCDRTGQNDSSSLALLPCRDLVRARPPSWAATPFRWVIARRLKRQPQRAPAKKRSIEGAKTCTLPLRSGPLPLLQHSPQRR